MNSAQEVAYILSYLEGLKPDPVQTVSTWADENRFLSGKAASEPGPWRTSRTPYMREIMDCLSACSPVERVVFMKGAQVGGTECGNNWLGYIIHHTPGPTLSVQPTVEMAKRNSKQRIDPLLEESPELRKLIKPARSKDSGNTILVKEFPGGILVMTGANSAAGLRSMPVRFLFLDEVDAFPGDVEDEGDPVALAEARTRTFARRKIYIVSTPTVKGLSRIEREYEASDMRRFMVPCPLCGAFQWLKFSQLKWPHNEPDKAAYECEHCGQLFAEHHKTEMLAHGYWEAHAEGDGRTAGFHISSLYSPLGWRSWAEIARAWLDAQGSDASIKSFKNTELGETYVESGEAPEWHRLYDRREDYRIATVPMGGLFLTAGADVQKDRLELEIVAWGRDRECWSVDYRVLQGDPAKADVWIALDAVLAESFTHENGVNLAILKLAIDTGYATQEVYDWVRRQQGDRVLAIKGVDRLGAPLGAPSHMDVTVEGKRKRRGLLVWPVGSSFTKSELYGCLRKDAPTDEQKAQGIRYPAGYCHFPKYGEDYFKQLTAERLVTSKNKRGFPFREWRKERDRNEALDCRVYARAAAASVGIDRFNETVWLRLETALGIVTEVTNPAPEVNTAQSKSTSAPQRRTIRSSYL
ncbi:MAG: phage terminase large subunit family protein [Alphaproteobacteria bacterium]|nr:phage terminase large subunit family protein [Alphaproteobacteria bacterium]